jgi:hypothetical protein
MPEGQITKRYCMNQGPQGFFCILLEHHAGQHLSIDNAALWRGTPGHPIWWDSADLARDPTGEIPKEALDPTLTQGEAGIVGRTASMANTELPGYTGELCASCGSPNTVRIGKCLQCHNPACMASGECG